MIKQLLAVAMMGLTALFAGAQTPLPLNPAVKHGTLPNGLNYYILHNEEPKERANFYIAQKVGSTLETQEQLGLAHFLEHMAFNGTKNYPGKNMLNYLQGKGIRFGADINAYTSFDETVYRINNVPTTDKALMDSVLLVLYDWSGSILLEEDEINAERGVIEEEWRSRNDANSRMWEAILPQIYSEYQYQQMPIGKMEVVRNFPPQAIRDYYTKWYRPDQQGIVIVGDFDADEMEAKVKELFSTIPMPENAAERTYPAVSDNEHPIFAYFKDKELQFPSIRVMFKEEKTPFEMRNTAEAYIEENLIQELISTMLNNRLSEYQLKPECKYAYASAGFGDYMVSKTKGAFQIFVIAKDDIMGAYNDALAVVARACKTGFMESELVRARDELIANYEKSYNERNNTNSHALGQELCRHFVDNEPAPGIEAEYKMLSQMASLFPEQVFNEYASMLLTPTNQVIILSQPEKDSMELITSENLVTGLENAINSQYEAYVDEVITEPLIAKTPVAGSILSEKPSAFGTTVFKLSNGARVIVKQTDFKADEIMFNAFKRGGKQSYDASVAPEVLLAEDIFSASKLGTFDNVKLKKYLAGKNVHGSYSIGNTVNEFEGTSSVKDLPTAMELIYAAFTDLQPDPATYASNADQSKTILANMGKQPAYVFQEHIQGALYNNSPMFRLPSVELYESADYAKGLNLIKASTANAADFDFIFVGNVGLDVLRPLLEKYIASLPSTGMKSVPASVTDIAIVPGMVNDSFELPMKSPQTMVFEARSGSNLPYNIENKVRVTMLGQIMAMIYTETLREEEGGTYSPSAYSMFNPYTGKWHFMTQFETNADIKQKLMDRANEEFMKVLKNGAKEEHFARAREAALKQYDIQVRKNSYWLNNIMLGTRGIDDVTNHKAAIENLTLKDFNKFIRNLYNGNDRITVVLNGVEETPAE